MIKIEMGIRFLEYIRNQENSPQIAFSIKPQELEMGVETNVYKFQLENAPYHISNPLVLRVYKEHSPTHRAIIEGTTQNYLAENGYTVPKVHYICTDSSWIGTHFIVMDFVPGELLWSLNKNVAQTMAELSLELHKIDPKPLRQKLLSAGIGEKHFTGLTERERFIYDEEISWLMPGLEWIHDNKPEPNYSIVHGDLHGKNIMMDNGRVSGVIDWAGLIEDNLRDVGSTMILYTVMAPSVLPNRRDEYRAIADEFLEAYSSVCTVDPWKLEYYEAVRCFSLFVDYEYGFELVLSSGMHRVGGKRFKEITGINDLKEPW